MVRIINAFDIPRVREEVLEELPIDIKVQARKEVSDVAHEFVPIRIRTRVREEVFQQLPFRGKGEAIIVLK